MKQVDFFYGDNFIGTDTSFPFEIIFPLPSDSYENGGKKTIKAVAYDTALNRQEDTVVFFLLFPQ
jgi:hypothetical protein